MVLNGINVLPRATTPPSDCGASVTREYSPGTALRDRRGRFWAVTSYRSTAFLEGAPPFEAWDLARVEHQFGPLVVVDGGAHKAIHAKPQHGCFRCPTVACVGCSCSSPGCTSCGDCRRVHGGSEQTWREAA